MGDGRQMIWQMGEDPKKGRGSLNGILGAARNPRTEGEELDDTSEVPVRWDG